MLIDTECLAGSANDPQRSLAAVWCVADGARLCEGPASWSCDVANPPRPLIRGGIMILSKIKQVAQQIYKTKIIIKIKINKRNVEHFLSSLSRLENRGLCNCVTEIKHKRLVFNSRNVGSDTNLSHPNISTYYRWARRGVLSHPQNPHAEYRRLGA